MFDDSERKTFKVGFVKRHGPDSDEHQGCIMLWLSWFHLFVQATAVLMLMMSSRFAGAASAAGAREPARLAP